MLQLPVRSRCCGIFCLLFLLCEAIIIMSQYKLEVIKWILFM